MSLEPLVYVGCSEVSNEIQFQKYFISKVIIASVKLNWWPVMRDSVWYALSVTVLIVVSYSYLPI